MSKLVFKTLTIEELRKDYSSNHGFVFKGNSKSSDASIEKLCDTLIAKKITEEYPQFVVRNDDNTTTFVYGQDFDSPAFFHKASIISQMTRAFQIESLVNALK